MQVYKTSNQVILLKLREMVFTDFTRDSIDIKDKSDEVTKHFHDASICATQSKKYQSFVYVPVLLQKYKEYSCALRNIDIKEDIWSKLILKDHQNSKPSRWTIFCQLKLLLKMHGARVTQEQKRHGARVTLEQKRVRTPTPSKSSIFSLLKDVVHTPDLQHHLIKLYIEYTKTLNPHQLTKVDCLDQQIYALRKAIQ